MATRLRSLAAAGLALALMAPAAASADYLNFGSWSGYGHSNNNHHNRGWNNWYGNNSWRSFGSGYNSYGRHCHTVQERTRDQHGQKAIIESLQCYDRYGRAYIVPGSSHILRWH
jgi:hypothetical protein